jgi:DNA-binding response OmpR family regulator
MNGQCAHRLSQLSKQLVDSLMSAAICAQEIRAEIAAVCSDDDGQTAQPRGAPGGESSHDGRRPLLDESTLSVTWRGNSVHLGHTRAFWLLDRLARRPNQYVTHLDLLHDVWDDEELSTATIRSAVRHLRRRLDDGGLGELAAGIRGHNGRYMLAL